MLYVCVCDRVGRLPVLPHAAIEQHDLRLAVQARVVEARHNVIVLGHLAIVTDNSRRLAVAREAEDELPQTETGSTDTERGAQGMRLGLPRRRRLARVPR